MIAPVNPRMQRHVPHYIANSLGLITTNYVPPVSDPTDPFSIDPSGTLSYAELAQVPFGYTYDAGQGVVLDISGNVYGYFDAAGTLQTLASLQGIPSTPDTGQNSASSGGSSQSTAAPAVAPAPAPEVPGGSVLSYEVSWRATLGLISADQVESALANQLPAHGMSVRSYNINRGGGWTLGVIGGALTLVVNDQIGHRLLHDAWSVLDAIAKNTFGSSNFETSSLSIISTPSGSGANPGGTPPPGLNLDTAWIKANWPILAVVGAGFVLLPSLMRKR